MHILHIILYSKCWYGVVVLEARSSWNVDWSLHQSKMILPAHRAPKHSCEELRPCQSGWHKKGAKMHQDAPRRRKSISSVYIV